MNIKVPNEGINTLLKKNVIRVIFFSFILLLASLAIGLLYLSFQSFENFVSYLSNYTADGNIEGFTLKTHLLLTRTALYAGILLLFTSSLSALKSKVLIKAVTKVVRQSSSYAKQQSYSLPNYLKEENKAYLLTLAICFLLGVYLRLKYLGRPIYYDEAYTYLSYVSKNPLLALSNYNEPNNHLLQTLVTLISDRILGTSTVHLRIPALLQGILLLPLTFYCARRYFGTRTALLATALVSCNPALVQFSTMARGYSLLCLWAITLLLMHQDVTATKKLSWYALFGTVAALGLWTIPVFIYCIIPFGLFGLLSQLNSKKENLSSLLKKYSVSAVICSLLTSLFYLAPILRSGIKQLVSNQHISALPWDEFSAAALHFIHWTVESWFHGYSLPLQLIIALGFFSFLLKEPKETRLRAFLLIALCSLAVILSLQRVLPFRRVWLMYLPILLIFCSAGLSQILTIFAKQKEPSTCWPSICLTIGIAVFSTHAVVRLHKNGFNDDQGTLIEARTILEEHSFQKNDRIIAVPPDDAPLRFEAKQKDPILLRLFDSIPEISGDLYVVTNKRQNFEQDGQASSIYLPEVLASKNIDTKYLEKLELVKEYKSSTLYVLKDTARYGTIFK